MMHNVGAHTFLILLFVVVSGVGTTYLSLMGYVSAGMLNVVLLMLLLVTFIICIGSFLSFYHQMRSEKNTATQEVERTQEAIE